MKNAPRSPSNALGNSLLARLAGIAVAATSLDAAMETDAKAAEMTTITHQKAMHCFGSDGGGSYGMYPIAVKTVTTDGKTTLTITPKKTAFFSGTEMTWNKYTARMFRKYVVVKTYNDFSIYDANKESTSMTSGFGKYNTPTFTIKKDDVHYVEGPSFDKDRALIIGPQKFEVYYPFKADGNVKSEFKVGPNNPLATSKPTEAILAAKVMGNMIWTLSDNASDGKTNLIRYQLNADDTVTQLGGVTSLGMTAEIPEQDKKSFVTCNDGKKKTTYFMVRNDSVNELLLIDTEDLKNTKKLPGVWDMATVDKDGRWEIRSLGDYENDKNDKTVIVDGYTGTTKVLLPNVAIDPLNGYVSLLPGYSNPTVFMVDTFADKGYIVRLDTAEVLASSPLQLFSTEFWELGGMGGGACVNNPTTKGTVEVTNTTPEPQPEATETEPTPDTIDSSDGDTGSETVAEAIPIEDQPDAAITQDTDTAPDVLGEVMTPDVQQDTKPDTSEPDVVAGDTDGSGEGDMSIQPDTVPEMTTLDTTTQPEVQSGSDTQTSQETSTGVQADASSKDASVVSKPPPPAKTDDSCTTSRVPSENNLLATGVLIAGAAYAIRRRQRQFSMIEK